MFLMYIDARLRPSVAITQIYFLQHRMYCSTGCIASPAREELGKGLAGATRYIRSSRYHKYKVLINSQVAVQPQSAMSAEAAVRIRYVAVIVRQKDGGSIIDTVLRAP